jgi:hypothetical protein
LEYGGIGVGTSQKAEVGCCCGAQEINGGELKPLPRPTPCRGSANLIVVRYQPIKSPNLKLRSPEVKPQVQGYHCLKPLVETIGGNQRRISLVDSIGGYLVDIYCWKLVQDKKPPKAKNVQVQVQEEIPETQDSQDSFKFGSSSQKAAQVKKQLKSSSAAQVKKPQRNLPHPERKPAAAVHL